MKRHLSNPRFLAFALLAVSTLSTSCNRGYGCPTNFSFPEFAGDLVSGVLSFLF